MGGLIPSSQGSEEHQKDLWVVKTEVTRQPTMPWMVIIRHVNGISFRNFTFFLYKSRHTEIAIPAQQKDPGITPTIFIFNL